MAHMPMNTAISYQHVIWSIQVCCAVWVQFFVIFKIRLLSLSFLYSVKVFVFFQGVHFNTAYPMHDLCKELPILLWQWLECPVSNKWPEGLKGPLNASIHQHYDIHIRCGTTNKINGGIRKKKNIGSTKTMLTSLKTQTNASKNAPLFSLSLSICSASPLEIVIPSLFSSKTPLWPKPYNTQTSLMIITAPFLNGGQSQFPPFSFHPNCGANDDYKIIWISLG